MRQKVRHTLRLRTMAKTQIKYPLATPSWEEMRHSDRHLLAEAARVRVGLIYILSITTFADITSL